MSLSRAARPLARTASAAPSSSRAKSTTANHWRSKNHMRGATQLPNPLPAIYPQRVVLSDGSTFTAYTTAPTPAVIRLTRDVTNNPLWAPGTDSRAALDAAADGRVGRFNRRFAMAEESPADEGAESPAAPSSGFEADDFSWMSEGAQEEKMSDRQRAGPQKKKKK